MFCLTHLSKKLFCLTQNNCFSMTLRAFFLIPPYTLKIYFKKILKVYFKKIVFFAIRICALK